MTPEERDLMIRMGKAITEHGEENRRIMNMLIDNRELSSKIPLVRNVTASTSPHGKVSVIDHEGTLNRFKMELKFEGGEMMTEQQRMDHSIRLLTEMEELLCEYGVTRLSGNYERSLKSISA